MAERLIEIEETLFSRAAGAENGAAAQRYTAKALACTIPDAFRDIGDRLFGLLTNGTLRLPVLPDYAAQALVVASDPEASFGDYERTVRPNAVMVTKLLRIANSPFYGTSSEITTIRQAMFQLGTRSLSQMVMQVVVESYGFTNSQDLEIVAREQAHALAVAHLSQIVAHELGLPTPEAFLSGLIHDLGRVVVPAVLQRGSVRVDAERAHEIVEALHPAVGARAAHNWKLPSLVLEAVLRHHDYTAAGKFNHYSSIGNIIAAAETLAFHFELDTNETAPTLNIAIEEHIVWRDLTLSPDRVKRIITAAGELAARLKSGDPDS